MIHEGKIMESLSSFPTCEDDQHEFKSSKTPLDNLKGKISTAVSAFANSGGGYFLAGINDAGNADGGLPNTIGREKLRDWFEKAILSVEPEPKYEVVLLSQTDGRGFINPDCSVVAIRIGESTCGPHMASNKCYYIRAGTQTVPARHFIVDAIWAKRHFSKPRLIHLFRCKPGNPEAVQLGIVAATISPALEISISLSPLGELLRGEEPYFPLQVPLIDRENPYFFDVATMFQAEERFGASVDLQVVYKDLSNNQYIYNANLKISRALSQFRFLGDANQRIADSLKSIEKTLAAIAKKNSE
ncbi:MAG: ATP-binding protein [Planctomycetaceae bacterium]